MSNRSKSCPSCFAHNGLLPVTAFGKNSNNADGLSTYCKACNNAKQRDWKAANADKVRAWRKAYVKRIKAMNRAKEALANGRR